MDKDTGSLDIGQKEAVRCTHSTTKAVDDTMPASLKRKGDDGISENVLQTPRERIQVGEPSGQDFVRDESCNQPSAKKSRSNVIQPGQLVDVSLPLLPDILDEEDERQSIPFAPLEARRAVLAKRPYLFQPIEVAEPSPSPRRIPKLLPSKNPLPFFLVEDDDCDVETMLANRSSVLAGTALPSPNGTITCLYDW